MLFTEVSGYCLPTPPCLHRHGGQKSIFMIQDQYVAPGQLLWHWDGCQAHGCSFLRTGRWAQRSSRRTGMDPQSSLFQAFLPGENLVFCSSKRKNPAYKLLLRCPQAPAPITFLWGSWALYPTLARHTITSVLWATSSHIILVNSVSLHTQSWARTLNMSPAVGQRQKWPNSSPGW